MSNSEILKGITNNTKPPPLPLSRSSRHLATQPSPQEHLQEYGPALPPSLASKTQDNTMKTPSTNAPFIDNPAPLEEPEAAAAAPPTPPGVSKADEVITVPPPNGSITEPNEGGKGDQEEQTSLDKTPQKKPAAAAGETAQHEVENEKNEETMASSVGEESEKENDENTELNQSEDFFRDSATDKSRMEKGFERAIDSFNWADPDEEVAMRRLDEEKQARKRLPEMKAPFSFDPKRKKGDPLVTMAMEEEISSQGRMTTSVEEPDRTSFIPLSRSTPSRRLYMQRDENYNDEDEDTSDFPRRSYTSIERKKKKKRKSTDKNGRKQIELERDDFGEIVNPEEEASAALSNKIDKRLEYLRSDAAWQSDWLIAASINNTTVNHDQDTLDETCNTAVERATAELQAKMKDTSGTISTVKAQRLRKEAERLAMKVFEVKQDSIHGVPETPRLVRTSDIIWDESIDIQNTAAVDKLLDDLIKRKLNHFNCTLKGIRVNGADGKPRIKIFGDIEKIHAYKILEEKMNKRYPNKYLTQEEDKDDFLKLPSSSSQPEAVLDNEDLDVSVNEAHSQPIMQFDNGKKIINPYGRITTFVLNVNANAIEDDVICRMRTICNPSVIAITARESCLRIREVRNRLKEELVKDPTQDAIKKACTISDVACPEGPLRVATMPDRAFSRQIDVMKKFETLNFGTFCDLYASARKISEHTADAVIKQTLDEEMTPEQAKEKLEEHLKSIAYILVGKGVDKKEASEAERRLEPRLKAIQTIKKHTGDRKKLTRSALEPIRNDAEKILQEFERDMNPCLAFNEAQVEHREINGGVSEARERCLVNFISPEDIVSHPEIFINLTKKNKTSWMIIVGTTDTNAIKDIFKDTLPNVGLMQISMRCVRIVLDGANGATIDSINCILMGSSNEKPLNDAQLSREIGKYGIGNSIHNGQLRQLMFECYKATDTVSIHNHYNSIFAHSKNEQIAAIIAETAFNRVFTSYPDIEAFKMSLNTLQRRRVENCDTFAHIQEVKVTRAKKTNADD